MKRWTRTFVLGALLGSSVAMADVVFDLGAQQLYYPATKLTDSNGYDTIDQYQEATYDTGAAIVSTGLTSVNGYYRPMEKRNGYFGVSIKEPKANTAISFSMYCYLNDDGCSIELLDKNAQAVNISFHYYSDYSNNLYGKISTAGQFAYGIGNNDTSINGTIEIDPTNIHISINGGTFAFDVPKTGFELKKVNFSLYTEGSTYIDYTDKLNALSISTSD